MTDDFANQIRRGLTIEELKQEVVSAVNEDAEMAAKQNVGKALDAMLVEVAECEIPETLVEEKAKEKFAVMLSDFRSSGTTDEEIKSMITREGFL
eukprot:scaffold7931_cov239-Pinguiococcus_pyrenoidosus.AAC.1